VNQHDRRNDWTVVIAVALIALGVWFLLGNVFGDWWQYAIRQAVRIAWPIALIALGLLLYFSSKRGGLSRADGRRLYRSRSERMLSGVLGGLGFYMGVDPTLVRIIYAVVTVLSGFWLGVLVYVIATIVIPEEPVGSDVVEPMWPQTGASRVEPPPSTTGWPHTGTETVQTPPPPPPPAPGEEPPPSAEGPAQS